MPEYLTSSHLQAAAPAARTLVVTEVELAEAARSASDFARGMVPHGYTIDLEPGALVQDALRLVDHAQQVLAAASRHERAHGTDDEAIAGLVQAAGHRFVVDLVPAAGPLVVESSGNLDSRLFELDAWVCRHAEPDDPIAPTQPVTVATTRHLTGSV